MSSDWSNALIDEIKAPTQSSIAIGPFGSRMKSDCYVDDGIRVVRGTNISSGRTFSGDFVFITPEKAKELGGANLQPNDLVFPHRGSGSVFGTITTNTFAQSKILQPSQPVLQHFEEIVSHPFQKIVEGTKTLNTLATLRDTLLPRLISGQLRLPEAEAMIEDVA